LGAEFGNLRTAQQWALDQGDTDTALRLGLGMTGFWWAQGAQREARECFDALLRRE
jgi:hypothetical protein